MNDEILDFIHRRFPEDSHWTDGNCYYFALILADRFNGTIFYDQIQGHFIVFIPKQCDYYDYNGLVYCQNEGDFKNWNDMIYDDFTHYRRIMRDCIM